MRELGIKSIVECLKDRGVQLEKLKALDFFAREGDWQTAHYANLVASIEAWEINPQFEESLRKNLPHAKVKIGDSHLLAKDASDKYDMIVLDNPQSCYGDYCEHFDALTASLPLLENTGIIVFNVKTQPFNYDLNRRWQRN